MSATDRCAAVTGGLAHAPAWIGFQRAHRELRRRLEAELGRCHGLSLSELEVLGRLAAAERRRRRIARLAADVELSVSRVSRIVDALERRDLVRREPCPEDSRATNAWLTDAGLEIAHAAQAAHLADVRHAFLDRLDDGELDTLDAVFTRLTREPA